MLKLRRVTSRAVISCVWSFVGCNFVALHCPLQFRMLAVSGLNFVVWRCGLEFRVVERSGFIFVVWSCGLQFRGMGVSASISLSGVAGFNFVR